MKTLARMVLVLFLPSKRFFSPCLTSQLRSLLRPPHPREMAKTVTLECSNCHSGGHEVVREVGHTPSFIWD